MQSATGEKPKLWGPSIIGFGSYHYVYDTGREGDMPLTSKSCLYIKKLADIDKEALKQLVFESVAAPRKKYS